MIKLKEVVTFNHFLSSAGITVAISSLFLVSLLVATTYNPGIFVFDTFSMALMGFGAVLILITILNLRRGTLFLDPKSSFSLIAYGFGMLGPKVLIPNSDIAFVMDVLDANQSSYEMLVTISGMQYCFKSTDSQQIQYMKTFSEKLLS